MKVVISGSFRKHLAQIMELKGYLEDFGIEVLNPKNKGTVENLINPEFVLFDGESEVDEEELEKRYLKSIASSDAHIVADFDGYIGETTTSELLFACSMNIPVYLVAPIQSTYILNKAPSIAMSSAFQNLINNGKIKIGLNSMIADYNIGGQQLKKGNNK
ncbi:MAG: hypothetical protein PHY08_07480 [Candidatus Cloacimonetes bacterium]|nr:hypothetical protein [Candidatus Cloacimonadota bacterium]